MAVDMNKSVRMINEIAQIAVDSKTGEIKKEYADALLKASDELDAKIALQKKEIQDMKDQLAKADIISKGGINSKRLAQKADFDNLIRAIATRQVTEQHWAKANEYVRFDANQMGGLLTVDIVREINRKIVEVSDVLRFVKVRPTSAATVTESVQTSNIEVQYEDELQTTANATPEESRKVMLSPFKAKCKVAFTEEDLQDTAVDLEAFTMESVRIAYAQRMGNTAMTGNGVKKPLGMIGQLESIDSGNLTLSAAQIIRLKGSIKSGYLNENRDKVAWFMDRETRAVVRGLSQASNSNLFWEVDGRLDDPERLLGFPIAEIAVGQFGAPTAGAYTVNNYSLGFGNWFQAYTMAVREEMTILNDPYTGAAQDLVFVNFRARHDGRPTNLEAAKFLKMTS
jgi:HK97 family phage major capsid protein